MERRDVLQSARIPKQIDAEVLLFKTYTVRQSFPAIAFLILWYIGFIQMNDGYSRIVMSVCFALSAFILGKRMGNLILYEYAILFLRYIFMKHKFFLRIRRDKSMEPLVFEKEEVVDTMNPAVRKFFNEVMSYILPRKPIKK